MKYKRDYEITISADNLDREFWQARHKGELKSGWDLEDYETMLSMISNIGKRLSRAVASLREQENCD